MLAGHRNAACRAGSKNCDGDRGAGVHGHDFSIYANGNRFRHGPPQLFGATADKAEWESRGAGREFAHRLILLWRATW